MDWVATLTTIALAGMILAAYTLGHRAGREVMRDIYNLPKRKGKQ